MNIEDAKNERETKEITVKKMKEDVRETTRIINTMLAALALRYQTVVRLKETNSAAEINNYIYKVEINF